MASFWIMGALFLLRWILVFNCGKSVFARTQNQKFETKMDLSYVNPRQKDRNEEYEKSPFRKSHYSPNRNNRRLEMPSYILQPNPISKKELNDLIDFSELLVHNLANDLPTPYRNDVVNSIKTNQHCGLVNLNSQCYINSVVQILFSSQIFVKEMKINKERCRILAALDCLYDSMQNNRLICPLFFYRYIGTHCDTLYNICKKAGFCSDVICTIANNLEKAGINIMSIKGKDGHFWKYPLLNLRGGFCIQERINAFIKDGPDVVFNEIIMVCGFLTKEISKIPIGKSSLLQIKEKQYELFGVIERVKNSQNEFHFLSYAKRNGKWYVFNDEAVCEESGTKILNEVDPYYSFYQRVKIKESS